MMNAFDKVSLGVFPTPIQKLENISRMLNTQVFVKSFWEIFYDVFLYI